MAIADTKSADTLSKNWYGLVILISKKVSHELPYDPIGFRDQDLTLFIIFLIEVCTTLGMEISFYSMAASG